MRPNLDTLPTEIVQMVCNDATLRRTFFTSRDTFRLADFRLVCRALYTKTLYLFAKKTSIRTFNNVYVGHRGMRGLSMLLHLSSIPFFRDQMEIITLRGIFPRYTRSYRSHYERIELQSEILDRDYEGSPEVYHLLYTLFSPLKLAASLHTINVGILSGATLKAIQDSEPDKKLFVLEFTPREVSTHDPELSWETISESSLSWRGISITTGHGGYSSRKRDHYRGSRYSSPSLSKLLDATSEIEELSITGCIQEFHGIGLKYCDGCSDLFDHNLYYVPYSNLRHIVLLEVYIDGYYLDSIIKRHLGTLRQVTFKEVALTRGNWFHIFRTMRLRKITKLRLYDLKQKKNMRHMFSLYSDIARWVSDQGVKVDGEHVESYLGFLLMDKRVVIAWGKYQVVKLYVVPGTVKWAYLDPSSSSQSASLHG